MDKKFKWRVKIKMNSKEKIKYIWVLEIVLINVIQRRQDRFDMWWRFSNERRWRFKAKFCKSLIKYLSDEVKKKLKEIKWRLVDTMKGFNDLFDIDSMVSRI